MKTGCRRPVCHIAIVLRHWDIQRSAQQSLQQLQAVRFVIVFVGGAWDMWYDVDCQTFQLQQQPRVLKFPVPKGTFLVLEVLKSSF